MGGYKAVLVHDINLWLLTACTLSSAPLEISKIVTSNKQATLKQNFTLKKKEGKEIKNPRRGERAVEWFR